MRGVLHTFRPAARAAYTLAYVCVCVRLCACSLARLLVSGVSVCVCGCVYARSGVRVCVHLPNAHGACTPVVSAAVVPLECR